MLPEASHKIFQNAADKLAIYGTKGEEYFSLPCFAVLKLQTTVFHARLAHKSFET